MFFDFLLTLLPHFQDAFAQAVTNSTLPVAIPTITGSGGTTIPYVINTVPQVAPAVATSSTDASSAALIVAITGITGVIAKTLVDRKDQNEITNSSATSQKRIMNDQIDNYKDFTTLSNYLKRVIDLSQQNPQASLATILANEEDVTTKETLGQRMGKFLNSVNQYYAAYYQGPIDNSMVNDSGSAKKVMNRTLRMIEDKTTPTGGTI
jgi:hypothetical protein